MKKDQTRNTGSENYFKIISNIPSAKEVLENKLKANATRNNRQNKFYSV